MPAVVRGFGHAVPAPMDQQGLWEDYFSQHYAGNRLAAKVWRASGITTRHGVVDPRHEDLSTTGTGERMRRFLAEAMPLGKEAASSALERAGIDASQVGLFAVVSCTGYATPGLDALLARDLGMRDDVQRLHLGHMGCFAAVPGLGAASDFVVARGRPALLLCVELTSLHVQPATETGRSDAPTPEDLQQMVAHALFSDAAAATVLLPGDGEAGVLGVEGDPAGLADLEVVDVVARTDPATADHMTWDVTDLGFRMGLSPFVPDVLGVHVRDVVTDLLGRNGLAIEDVGGWAIHPGGRRIVEVVGERLGLDEAALAPSYEVLRDFGNCSSSTVLLVLERLLAQRPAALERPGAPVVAMAFGPGLTLYTSLLRRR